MRSRTNISLWGLSASTINEFEKYLQSKIKELQIRMDAYHEVLEEIANEKRHYANANPELDKDTKEEDK